VTTRVMGTYGYAAPEYVSTGMYIRVFLPQYVYPSIVMVDNLCKHHKCIISEMFFHRAKC
jgi:hypothetical protein